MRYLQQILLGLAIASGLSSCNLGSGASISATSANCDPVSGNNQCVVTLSYNSNNKSDALGVNYSPQQLAQFALSVASCPTPKSSSGTQTCTIPVGYTSNGSRSSEKVTFTLGNAKSDAITLSGK